MNTGKLSICLVVILSFVIGVNNLWATMEHYTDVYDDMSLSQQNDNKDNEYVIRPTGSNGKYGYYLKNPLRKAFAGEYESATSFSEGLAAVRNGGKYGFIDKTGRLVISYMYDGAYSFHEGLAAVKKGGKWGYVDKTGRLVISYMYDEAYSFHEGMASVRNGGKYGFIDKTGRLIVSYKYDRVKDFNEGMAGVGMSKKGMAFGVEIKEIYWGYVDKSGREVVPPIYVAVGDFSEGLSYVSKRGQGWGFIDKTGRVVVPTIYEGAYDFSDGMAVVKKGGMWGVIDKTGKIILPIKYKRELYIRGGKIYDSISGTTPINIEKTSQSSNVWTLNTTYVKPAPKRVVDPMKKPIKWVGDYVDGLAPARANDDLYGFVNEKREIVIPCIYNSVKPFVEGLSYVKIKDKYGYINKEGKVVVPVIYDYLSGFFEGLAAGKIMGKCGYVDKTGNEVIPFIYDETLVFYDGMGKVKKYDMYGYVDKTGKEIVPVKYISIGEFKDGLAVVKGYTGRKMGYVDKSGREVLPLTFDDAKDFYEGMTVVCKGDNWYVIDKTGKILYNLKGHNVESGFKKGGLLTIVKWYKQGWKQPTYGVIDKTGRVILPPKYRFVSISEDGIYAETTRGADEWYDHTGKKIKKK